MRLIALAAVSILALAACSQGGEPAVAPPAEPATMLAGVDLGQSVRALGTEPFWSVELTGTEMIYTSPEPPEYRAVQPKPVVQGTTATLDSRTATGAAFTVTLVATECSDGMSDRTYPLTAMVTIGDVRLNGCAASSAAILSAGESGPVGEPQPAA
jgi:uncharacterized membrane protein